jgi:competence protein ComEA
VDERGWQAGAWAVAAVAAVLLATRLLDSGPQPPPVAVGGAAKPAGRGGESAAAAPDGPYVHVAGAVRRPGLYRLPRGARVAAAVRRAGGVAAGGDLNLVNLAARLRDGQQVVVPVAAPGGGGAGSAGGGAADAPISLGAATAEQLDELDGIGPTLAERIVEHRQASGGFGSIDELDQVEGIGAKRLEALRDALTP